MDIRDPISTWLLARLYNEDQGMERRELVRQLCQKSIQFMEDEDSFGKKLLELERAKYVISDTKVNIDLATHETSLGTRFTITETGLLAFRRQIVSPIDKVLDDPDGVDSSVLAKFRATITTLKSSPGSTQDNIIKWTIQNTPAVLSFIRAITQTAS